MSTRMLSGALLALVLVVTIAGQAPKAPDPTAILKGVEKLYNSTNTLEATFTQTFIDRGRQRSVQKGTVYLSKPKKTRWQYSMPDGNWFLSDEKYAYDYDKDANSVERIRLKETDDMRIPLAFLLGKLDFQKDFGTFETTQDGANVLIKAKPKNDKLLFTEVAMLIAPDSTLRRVSVTGQDSSVQQFVLEGEKRNGPINPALFRFSLPAGAKLIEADE